MATKKTPTVPPIPAPAAAPVPVVQQTVVQQPVAQPYQPAPYQQGPYIQPGPPSGLSIASMVVGLVSLFLSLFGSGLLPGIAAVITGHLAARRQPHAKGFWLTGIITGYVSIGIGLIVVAFWVVIFAVGAASGWSSS
jgi:hypothetical protein